MLLLALLLQAAAQEPPAGGPPAADPPSGPLLESLHGTVQVRYRGRRTGDASDTDLYQYLSLNAGDPEKHWITAAASARLAEDLDGERSTKGFFVFDSLDDSYRHGSTARLYTAYVDLHRPLPGFTLRAGRQILEELPEAVPLDGASARQKLGEGLTLALFGGLPVNLFESSPSGDRMYGGWIEAEPWRRGRARLEYLHLEDETLFGLFDDDLIGVSAEQGAGPFRMYARYTALERESRDATARLTGTFVDTGLLLDAQVTYLFERQQALSYALDPYSIFLFELEPYWQFSLRGSQALGERFAIDVSATRRELADSSDERTFNREFTRISLSPRLQGWPAESLSLALSADYWRSTGDDFWTAGGDVRWEARPEIALSAGTAFSLYTIDAFTGEERERVRTVHAAVRWKLRPAMVLDVRFSFERNDFDDFQTLEVGVRHAF